MILSHISDHTFYDLVADWNRWQHNPQELAYEAPTHERHLVRTLAPSLLDQTKTRHHMLHGPRRSGKTTMLWQAIRYLLGEGVPSGQIFYLKMDDPQLKNETLPAIWEGIKTLCPELSASQPVYLMADELAKCDGWRSWLKTCADPPSEPLRVLGSSSFPFSDKSDDKETAVDRIVDHLVLPCSFAEYVEMTLGVDILPKWFHEPAANLKERLAALPRSTRPDPVLNSALLGFALYSGYPEYSEYSKSFPLPVSTEPHYRSIMQAQEGLQKIAAEVIYQDIPNEMRQGSGEELHDLFHKTAGWMTGLGTAGKIGNEMDMDNKRARAYMESMERARLVFRLSNHSLSDIGSNKGNKKICFYDTGMCWAVLRTGSKLAEQHKRLGKAWENMAGSALKHLSEYTGQNLTFWRLGDNYEVDFILNTYDAPLGFEVKSRNTTRRGLRKFREKHPDMDIACYLIPRDGPVLPAKTDSEQIGSIPLAFFLLAVNAQTCQQMLDRFHLAECDIYTVKIDGIQIYPKYGTNKPVFQQGDLVMLNDREASPLLDDDKLEQSGWNPATRPSGV